MTVPLTADSPVPSLIFHDGLGDRVPIADPGGRRLEVLRVRPDLAGREDFESALRERAALLAGFADPSFARVHRVDRLPPPSATLAVVSDRPDGTRLSFLLGRAAGGTLDTTPRVAIAALRQLVPALARFHTHAPGCAHGALAPERIFVGPNGRLAMLDAALGPAVERLSLPRRQLWREFRIAIPAAAGSARLDERSDVTQVGAIALALLLGRPLGADDFPERVAELDREAADRWTARGRPVPPAVAAWLLRALQLDPRRSFAAMSDALESLMQTPAWQIDEASAGHVLAAWATGETVARVARREQVIHLAADNPSPTARPATAPTARPVSAPWPAPSIAPRPAPPIAPRPAPAMTPPSAPSIAPRPAPSIAPRPARTPAPRAVRPPVEVRRRSPRWPWVAVALVSIAAVVAVTGRDLLPFAARHGTVAIDSTPRGVDVFVDGLPHGATPVELTLTAGPHIVELRGRGAPHVLPIRIAAGERVSQHVSFRTGAGGGAARSVAVPADPASGWLAVEAPFDMEIREAGRLIGVARTGRVELAPGRHVIEIANATLGLRETREVRVRAGEPTPLVVQMPFGTVHLNARPWAEVWLDGERLGDTPIGNLSVTAGAHEFVFRHPDYGEQRRAVSVTVTEPVHLTVDMRPR